MNYNISQQQIFDEMGKSVPYSVGFNKSLAGGRDGVTLTTPPPRQVVLNSPPPVLQTTPNFSDVLTKGGIPTIGTSYSQSQQPIIIVPQTVQPASTPTPCPECPVCAELPEQEVKQNPKGLTDDQMNRTLFDILATKPVDISCACEAFDYYSMTDPLEGEFKWKSDMDFVYRDQPKITPTNILDVMNNPNSNQWKSSKELTVKYSRWSPDPNTKYANNNPPIRILLLHDVLDSKESWWCAQKLLSPFFDTIAIDLIGTGESTLPRGINNSGEKGDQTEAQPVPWSYSFHANYLVALAETVWPGETYYVVGADFGGQIAATMASISQQVKGFIMINPPGFHGNNFPGIQYLDFYEMRKIISDEDLSNLPTSFTARVRDLLLGALKGSDCDGRNNSTLKLVLKQYVNLDRKRILIDQIVAFSQTPYQEFPQTNNNDGGLAVQSITAPCLIVTGQGDVVCTPESRHFYPIVYYKSEVSTITIPHVGHLIHIENPKVIAEIIVDFIREKEGIDQLKDAFIGFLGTTRGNEIQIISKLRNLYFT